MTITENSLSTRCTNYCDVVLHTNLTVLQQNTSYFLRTSVVFLLLPGQVTLDYASEWYNVLTSCDSIGVYSIFTHDDFLRLQYWSINDHNPDTSFVVVSHDVFLCSCTHTTMHNTLLTCTTLLARPVAQRQSYLTRPEAHRQFTLTRPEAQR